MLYRPGKDLEKSQKRVTKEEGRQPKVTNSRANSFSVCNKARKKNGCWPVENDYGFAQGLNEARRTGKNPLKDRGSCGNVLTLGGSVLERHVVLIREAPEIDARVGSLLTPAPHQHPDGRGGSEASRICIPYPLYEFQAQNQLVAIDYRTAGLLPVDRRESCLAESSTGLQDDRSVEDDAPVVEQNHVRKPFLTKLAIAEAALREDRDKESRPLEGAALGADIPAYVTRVKALSQLVRKRCGDADGELEVEDLKLLRSGQNIPLIVMTGHGSGLGLRKIGIPRRRRSCGVQRSFCRLCGSFGRLQGLAQRLKLRMPFQPPYQQPCVKTVLGRLALLGVILAATRALGHVTRYVSVLKRHVPILNRRAAPRNGYKGGRLCDQNDLAVLRALASGFGRRPCRIELYC